MLFPKLLAVANRCQLETGNINQSRSFIPKLVDLINDVLITNTVSWFNDQQTITITADNGTFMGLVLLAVFFIGDTGVVKLAGVRLTPSKSGEDLAESIYKIITEDAKIGCNNAKDKIKGFTGDGAFSTRKFTI